MIGQNRQYIFMLEETKYWNIKHYLNTRYIILATIRFVHRRTWSSTEECNYDTQLHVTFKNLREDLLSFND